MATIRLHGTTITAEPKEQLPNGDWLMEAKHHGPRCAPGTTVRVTQSEIIEMAAAEQPADSGMGELEKAMAEERETLPSVQELLAAAKDKQEIDHGQEEKRA